jgi:hypothetical protein
MHDFVPTFSDAYVFRLKERIKELEQVVRDSMCECFDEYNHPLAHICDRCRVLGEDPRPTVSTP